MLVSQYLVQLLEALATLHIVDRPDLTLSRRTDLIVDRWEDRSFAIPFR